MTLQAPDGYPTWRRPRRYGYGEAVQAAGTIVAPLLAGFSVTLTVLVIDRADAIRWPDLALALLVSAAAVLVMAIQCAYSARQYLARPDEIVTWWPGIDDADDQRYAPAWRDDVRSTQFGHALLHERWIGRFRVFYHLGIVLILLALVAIVVPPGGIAPLRIVAIGVALAAALGEVVWVAATVVEARAAPRDPAALTLPRVEGSLLTRVVAWIVLPDRQVVPLDITQRDAPSSEAKT